VLHAPCIVPGKYQPVFHYRAAFVPATVLVPGHFCHVRDALLAVSSLLIVSVLSCPIGPLVAVAPRQQTTVPAQPLQREPTVCWTPSPLCAGPHILRSTPWEVCQTHTRILCPICTCHSGMQVVCSLTSRSLLSYSLIFKAGCSLQEPAGLGRISQRRNSV
jgi:hypothetical protein